MELRIHSDSTVGDLKSQFSALFPNLKLSVFKKTHRRLQPSPIAQLVTANTLLRKHAPKMRTGNFKFSPTTSVADFEQGLQREFDLSVQVFRRSGSSWIETIQTDNRSLQEQNEMSTGGYKRLPFNEYTLFL